MSPNTNIPLDPACNSSSEPCQLSSQELCFNPNSNKPLATELVNSSFSKSYQQVMQIAHDFQQTSEALSSTITQIQSDMGDVDDLETVDKSSLVGAINDVNTHAETNSSVISNTKSELGNINSLTTDNKTSVVNAINEVDSHTDTNTSSITRIDSEIGTLSSLDTDNKSSLVGAINEVDTHTDNNTILLSVLNSEVGSLNNLETDNKSSLVEAINEVNDNADYNTASIARVQSDVGSLGNLITDNKTSIVGAINEIDIHADTNAIDIVHLQTDMGDIANLETEDKSSVVNAINEVNSISTASASAVSALQTADTQNVKLTGDQTVAGVKTFSDAPVVPSLTSSTQIQSSDGVGFDENGKLIPIKTIAAIQLPPSADYIGTDSAGDAVKKTADTTVTSESSALVTSGAVFNSVKDVSDKVGDLTSLDTTDKSNLVSAINEVDSALSTKSDIGHKHSADDITSGVLPVARGGTGVTTQADINKAFVSNLEAGESDVTDGTEFVSSYASDNGFASTEEGSLHTPYKRQFIKVWNYIKDKISSVLGLTASTYGGRASTAETADYAKNMYFQTIDLSAQSTSNFYPLFFYTESAFAEVAIYSPSSPGSAEYNQNRIHFEISTHGWNDLQYSLNIREYSCWQSDEITIGCIGIGYSDGGWAIWLRGGMSYRCYTRSASPSLKTADYTFGNEKYTVGTNYYGGTNSKVDVVFTPQSTITDGSYSNRTITASTIKAENNFIGNLTGNVSGSSGSCTGNSATATKATQDGDGNVITATYATKTETGSLSSLTTTDKSNLVSAINEVQSGIGGYKIVRFNITSTASISLSHTSPTLITNMSAGSLDLLSGVFLASIPATGSGQGIPLPTYIPASLVSTGSTMALYVNTIPGGIDIKTTKDKITFYKIVPVTS